MAQELGTGYVTIMPSTRGMSKEIQDALGGAFDSSLNKAEGRFRGFFGKVAAAGAAVLAAVGIGKLAKSTVALGVSYNALEQSSKAAFTTILGSGEAAVKMQEQIRAFAMTSPFPRQAFITATQQLLGFGLSAEKIIPTLNAVQDAVAAVGGDANTISDITDALAEIQGTGKLSGDTLQRLGQYGINAADIIGKQMGLTANQIRDMASKPGGIPAAKVWDPLINGLEGRFGGAAANVKQTWVGAVDRIKGAWRDISSALVEPFVSKSGGGLAVGWANKFADLLRKIEPQVTPMMNKIIDLATTMGPKILAGAQAFSPLLFVIRALQPIMPQLEIAFQGVAGALQGAFVTAGPVVLRLLSDLALVVGLLAPSIGVVANMLAQVLMVALTDLVPPLTTLVMALLPLFVQMLEILLPAVLPLLPVLLDLALQVLPVLAEFLQTVVDVTTGFLIPALLWLTQAVGNNIPLILAIAGAVLAWKLAIDAVSFVQLIAGLAASTAAWTSNTAAMLVSKAETLILMGMYAKDFVVSVASTIASIAASTGAWIANTVAQSAAKIVILAGAAALGVATAAQWLFNAALSANPIGIVITAIAALVAGLVWFFTQTEVGKKAWAAFTKFLGEAWTNTVNFIKGGVNMVIGFINSIIDAINVVGGALKIASFGAINIHLGKIPKLADSGTIKARPGGTLALLAEGGRDESVVDTGKLNDLMVAASDGGGGVSVTIVNKAGVHLDDLIELHIRQADGRSEQVTIGGLRNA